MKVRSLLGLGVVCLSIACSSSSDDARSENAQAAAPVPIMRVRATKTTFEKLGVSGWRVYQGLTQTVVLALGPDGVPRGGVRIDKGDDGVVKMRFLTRDYGLVSVTPNGNDYANSTTSESQRLLEAAARDLPKNDDERGRVAYGCGLTLFFAGLGCAFGLALCPSIAGCAAAVVACGGAGAATYNCFEGEERLKDIERRLRELEKEKEQKAVANGASCTQSEGAGCKSAHVELTGVRPADEPIAHDDDAVDMTRVEPPTADYPGGYAVGQSAVRDVSETGLSCEGMTVLDCGMTGGRAFCRCVVAQ